MESRRVWIGCLASYNAGRLHGDWFELDDWPDDLEALTEAVKAMIKAGPCPNGEEWHICDHENWHGLTIDRYTSLETLVKWEAIFTEHDNIPGPVIAHAIGEDRVEALPDLYEGQAKSMAEYAEDRAEEMGLEIPDWLRSHIDWESIGHEWEISDYFTIDNPEGGVFVLSRRA